MTSAARDASTPRGEPSTTPTAPRRLVPPARTTVRLRASLARREDVPRSYVRGS